MKYPVMGGDLIAFGGTGFLSDTIKLVTHSPLSHVAMVLDPSMPVNGKKQTETYIIESTIINGVSGPQVNPLASRMAGYDKGGKIWRLRLSRKIWSFIDWDALWTKAADKLAAGDTYNKLELGDYILRKLPIIQYDPELYEANPKAEVCSEFIAELLKAGGIPGLKPAETSPEVLAAWHLWEDQLQLVGTPETIPNFNYL